MAYFKMNKTALIFLLIFIGKFASAQPYTLQQCIDLAIKNNPLSKQADLNVRQSILNERQAKANLLPNLNGQFQNFYNVGRTIDRFTNQFANATVQSMNLGLSSSVTLFSGLQNHNNILQSKINTEASKKIADDNRNDLSLNVANAFLRVLLAKEIISVRQKQVTLSKEQEERTKQLFDAGVVARGNLLQAQAQIASEELQLVNARNELSNAMLALALLVNVSSVEGFDIVSPPIPQPESLGLADNADQIVGLAMQNNPGVKGAELRVNSAEKDIQMSKGSALPTLNLFGSLGTGYSGLAQYITATQVNSIPVGYTADGEEVFSDVVSYTTAKSPLSRQLDENVNKTYGVTLSVPLFNNLQAHNRVEQAKLGKQIAALNRDQEKLNLRNEIQIAYNAALAARNRYNAGKKNMEALEENYKYAQTRLEAGAISVFEFNQNKTSLAQAESELLQSKYEYVFRIKVLDFYMGKPIAL